MSDNPVVLVSGGSKGLGAAISRDLLGRGFVVCTFSRSRTPFVSEAEAEHGGSRFLFEELDIADHEAARSFVLKVARGFGRIDALINNAALLAEGVLPTMRRERVLGVIEINVSATIILTQLVSRVMLTRSSGNIINVTSVDGIRGYRGVSVYSASKAAIDGFTRSLAHELGPRGIRVNAIAPGFFESELTGGVTPEQKKHILRRTPLGRLGRVEDLLGTVRFLLSEDSAFITGQTMVVDGGITC
jgi:3-oxoacyl-[acyl-carrier protein] reductase